MSKYNSAVIGDAYSYPADKEHIHNYATQQEYSDLDGNKKETKMIFVSKYPVTVNSNADSDAEIEIKFEQTITSGSSTGYDIGGTAGLTGEIDFLVGQIDGSAGYSGEREENTVYSDSTITGKSFGVQVCNWEDYTQDGDNNEVPGNKYDFNVAPVVLKSLPLSNGDTPFMLTYAVTPLNQGHIAPAIPDNIHVNTVSASALNVTWKNVSTPERPVSQYEILQRNVSAKEDNFVSVGTVEATASSFLATNLNPETTYAYKVRSIYDGTYSVCSSEAQGTTLPLEDSGPSFIKHPANAFVKEADDSNGTTEASYNSHEVSGKGVKGVIAGSNGGTFTDVFAQTNTTPAAGEGSTEGASVVSGMNNVNNKFDETLNSVTEDTYNSNGHSIPLSWLINANLNHKYPVIKGDFSKFKSTTVENAESMNLRGTMHQSAHLIYSELTSKNELYSTILDKLSLTGDSTKLFYIAVTDGAGTELPTGIWMNGEDVEISMPVSDANAVLMGIDADGAAQTFEPVSYDNGVAVYRLPALMQVFAVQTKQEDPTEKPTEQPAEETTAPTEQPAEKTTVPADQPTDPTEKTTETPTERAADANSSTKDSATGGTSNTSSTVTDGTTTGGTSASGDAVQTGVSSAAIIALIILAMSALIIGTFVSKRRKGE